MEEKHDGDSSRPAASKEQLEQNIGSKRSQEALARYKLFFERARDILLFMHTDGRIVEANPAAVTAYGYSHKELVSMRIHDLRAPETLDVLESQLEQADAIGILFETTHRRKDGSTFPVEINAIGTVIGDERFILSIIRDITARKQVEEALKESELRFRKMLEEVELLAIMVDTEGKVTFVNDYLVDLTGWEKKEILGKPFENFVAPEERESVRRIFLESIARGEVVPRYETDIITSWGETRTISFANVLLRDVQGNIAGTANLGQDITEQKRIAEEIRESRKQVLDILESITDGFFALDNDWRFTYVNKRAAQLIGKRKEELLFRNMWDALPQLVGTRFDIEYHKAKERMMPISFEEFYQPLNRWLEVHAHPYQNGLSAYVSDITVRKQAERALRESEERYRNLVELSPDGIAVHREGKLIYVNPATVKMFGAADAGELIGKPVISFVHPDYKEIVIERIKRQQQGKIVGLIEEKFVRVDGSPIDVEVGAAPIIYEGKPAMQVVFRDITERVKAEEALKESEARFRKVFEEGPLGMAIVGLDYKFLKVNSRLAQMLGYSEEELTKLGFPDVSHPEDLGKDLELAEKLVSGEIPFYYLEKRNIKKNKEVVWHAITATVIRDEEGKPLYFLGMSEDITDRKKAEAELQQARQLGDALNNINAAINSTLDFDEIMCRVVVDAARAIGSERAGIILREDNFWVTRYGYNLPAEVYGTRLTEAEARATTLAAKTKTTVVVNDTYRDERVDRAVMERFGIRSLLAIPLVVKGNTIGVMAFSYHSAPIGFTGSQVDFATKLGVSVSLALENARLFRELREKNK